MGDFALNTAATNYINLLQNDTSSDLKGGQEGEGVWGALWSGGGDMRGKVEAAMKGTDPAGLNSKAAVWQGVESDLHGHTQTLANVYSSLKGAWKGDDADQAMDIMHGLVATSNDATTNSGKLHGVLTNVSSDIKTVKDSWGHDAGAMDGFGNWVSGDDDRQAATDYNNMIKNVQTYYQRDLPHSAGTQLPQGAAPTPLTPDAPNGAKGAAGGPSSGGAGSAAHVGDPNGPHIGDPKLPDGQQLKGPHEPPETTAPVTGPGLTGAGGSGTYSPAAASYDGGGSGYGSVDPSTSLASYDPTGGMGGGLGGAGGGLGAGVGAGGGLGGASGLAGAGLGGGAGAGLGAGAGAGAGGAGEAGAAGAGRGGMVPMHPMGRGGGSGDDDERERSTWLSEDEDVWGDDDAAPTIIS